MKKWSLTISNTLQYFAELNFVNLFIRILVNKNYLKRSLKLTSFSYYFLHHVLVTSREWLLAFGALL